MIELPASIRDLVAMHRRIALDSNVLIDLLDGAGSRAYTAAAIALGEVEGG